MWLCFSLVLSRRRIDKRLRRRNPRAVKDSTTMTVSSVGQSTRPKWWREVSGLSEGGAVEVRPRRDGRQRIVLAPKVALAGERREQL